jgi:plastocyanin
MKKLTLTAPLALALFTAACGGGGGSEPAAKPESAPSAAPSAPAVDPSKLGKVAGKVTIEGAAPAQEPIQMAADPNCARMHTTPVNTQYYEVGEGGGVANAFVYLKTGVQGQHPAPTEPVILDQQGCTYHPHVIGIQVGQPLEIVNSDETLHNIHAMPKKNKEFNIGQPVKGLKTERTFTEVEVMVPFKCDVHKWMNSYAGVLDHPFFAVSGPDGSFTINGVPPGSYTVEVWHERMDPKEMNVTVAEAATAEANFTLAAK